MINTSPYPLEIDAKSTQAMKKPKFNSQTCESKSNADLEQTKVFIDGNTSKNNKNKRKKSADLLCLNGRQTEFKYSTNSLCELNNGFCHSNINNDRLVDSVRPNNDQTVPLSISCSALSKQQTVLLRDNEIFKNFANLTVYHQISVSCKIEDKKIILNTP
jgi:hypothetical protein